MSKNLKIAYIVNARIPTEKAHGYQIAKMCEEWSRAGAAVTLFVPKRANPIQKDVFSYYGVEKNFEVVSVPCLDAVRFAAILGPFAFIIQMRSFIRALRHAGVPKDAIVYSRNPEIVAAYCRAGQKAIYDAHNFPERPERLIRLIRGAAIVANSSGTAEEFKKRGFDRVLAIQNGVDIEKFDISGEKAAFRKSFGLPESGRIAMYVGHLYPWKGADSVLGAAELLRDITFVFAGGTAEDRDRYAEHARAKGISNAIFLGHRERADIPKLLKAADILLLPNAPVSKESEKYTSPLKMFEYMASGVPIAASSLPSIREVLSDDTAWLFKAGDPAALATALRSAFDDAAASAAKARAARSTVSRYSWKARAEAILDFIAK